MTIVDIYDAKTRLSKLIEEAAAGNDVIITRSGKPVVRLSRLASAKRKLQFGVLKGKIKVSPEFDGPAQGEISRQFEGP